MHCFNGLDGILSVIPRRLELIAPCKPVEKRRSGFLPYAYGAVSLNIAVSPDWTNPSSRPSDVSSQQ
jgi:hypothetical protein